MQSFLSFFTLSLLSVYLIYKSSKSVNTFIVSSKTYEVNGTWYIPFIYIASYMTSFPEQSGLLSLAIIFCCVFYVRNFLEPAFSRSYLTFYILFFAWNCVNLVRVDDYFIGIMMLIKLFLPILFYKLAYIGFSTKESIWGFFEIMSKLTVVYAILVVIGKLLHIGLIYDYFGMVTFIFPFIMYQKTKDKKYLLYCLLCFSGNLIYVKRTPLIGVLCMILAWLILKYKLKAALPAALLFIITVLSVLYIPAITNRVFFEGFEPSDIDSDLLFSGEILEYVNSNGRVGMWSYLLEYFYANKPIIGWGPGAVKVWMASPLNFNADTFQRVHNDWLQILCESGLIGVGLLILMYIGLFRKTITVFYLKDVPSELRLLVLACIMGSIGTIVHMFFENSMGCVSFIMPMVWTAMFFRYIDFLQSTISTNEIKS